MENKSAIVLAMFGTSVESGLQGVLNLYEQVKAAYPASNVVLSFTSVFLCNIWRKRAVDPAYLLNYPDIPEEILFIQGPLAVIAGLQEKGYRDIVVQAVYLAPAEEYLDLLGYVEALASIKTVKEKYRPFRKLVVGRPAFGALVSSQYSYGEDILLTARSLAADSALAVKESAALVYLGHGNDTISTCGYYLELVVRMKEVSPGLEVFFGAMEGFPSCHDVLQQLIKAGIKKIILKPFLPVAGMHAQRDIFGTGADSWKSIFEQQGIEVLPVSAGLGEQNDFAQIFIDHIKDAAMEAAIDLSL